MASSLGSVQTGITSQRGEPVQVFIPDIDNSITVAVGVSSTTGTLTSAAPMLRIVSTVDCYINLNGAATTSDMYLPADTVEVIGLPGDTNTIRVIRSASDGNLYVTPCMP